MRFLTMSTVVAGIALILAADGASAADYRAFAPLLADLKGWQGGPPLRTGKTIDGKPVTAMRRYARLKSGGTADAAVVTGLSFDDAVDTITPGVSVDTPDSHLLPLSLKGFKGSKSWDRRENGGSIALQISPNASFTFTYRDISEKEALALVGKFNLKTMGDVAIGK